MTPESEVRLVAMTSEQAQELQVVAGMFAVASVADAADDVKEQRLDWSMLLSDLHAAFENGITEEQVQRIADGYYGGMPDQLDLAEIEIHRLVAALSTPLTEGEQ